MSGIRVVLFLLPAFVLTAGLAPAQPGIHISQVDPSGQLTHSTFDPSAGTLAKAPTPGPNGTFKYWDGLPATNYYLTPNYTTSPPNPQIAVGPDDILTVVNRTIARYPNPNAAGNTGAANPYSYPPTHAALIDAWFGLPGGRLPRWLVSVRRNASQPTCLVDNISIRYDQLQGPLRFPGDGYGPGSTPVELGAADFEMGQLRLLDHGNRCSDLCQGTSDLFTPPIVPIAGGPSVGGFNSNWAGYVIPINVVIPTGSGLSGATTVGAPFCANGGNPATLPPGGGTQNYNFGPGNAAGTVTAGCTNYYPTAARMGIDNDNIILTSPVLDQTQTLFAPEGAGLPGGAFAGTRVTTVPKMVVYNGTSLTLSFGPFTFPGNVTTLGAVNLYDDIWTGTLTGCANNLSSLLICIGGKNPVPGIIPQIGPTPGAYGIFRL